MNQTKAIKKSDIVPKWYVIDASGKNLGRVAVQIATLLNGKNNVTYAANLFSGDNVIVINTDEVAISHGKEMTKMYYRHSGYPGGLRTQSFSQLKTKNSTVIIKRAVKGMLPHTKLGDVMLKHLYLYRDANHEHEAQQPVTL